MTKPAAAKLTVKQDPENEIESEVLAQAIVEVFAAAKKLLGGCPCWIAGAAWSM